MKSRFETILRTFLKHFALVIVRAYQVVLSPFLGGACRFEPTCSQYAVDVIQNQNSTTAFYLILKRLSNCHPWGGQGYDPAPKTPPIKERSLIS